MCVDALSSQCRFSDHQSSVYCAVLQLVISYYMKANIMCEYTRDEWLTGFTRMNLDSLDKLRSKLPDLRAELRDPQRFQDVYNFAFNWAREVRHWLDRC